MIFYLHLDLWNRISKHFIISLNFPCLVYCVVCLCRFLVFLWWGIFVEVAVEEVSRIFHKNWGRLNFANTFALAENGAIFIRHQTSKKQVR